MKKDQKSVRGGIEDFLCPFTDMYITQGSNSAYSHKGIMANDVRGLKKGVKYPYYAPCTCKAIKTYPNSGQVMWQSINKVRFANGRIDYATFMTVHDDTMDAVAGKTYVNQGSQLGNMGTKGNASGVHCHIEVSQSADTSWFKNKYGNYMFNNEYDLDDCYFVDSTNIIEGMGGNWKTTDAVPVEENKEVIDQILHIGSNVMFDGIFKVNGINVRSNTFTCFALTGTPTKEYHNIPSNDFIECDSNGNEIGQDQILYVGSYVKNNNVYKVIDIDKRTDSAKLNINGKDVWVFCKPLKEV